MTAISLPARARFDDRAARRLLLVGLFVAAVVAFLVFRGQWTLPHNDDEPLFRSLNGVREAANSNRAILDPIRNGIGGLVGVFNELLAALGWPGVIGVVSAIGLATGGIRIALLAGLGLASLGVLGLWDESMATLGMILAAVLISIAVGLPLGLLAGRSNRVSAVLSPILDVMQIMPTLAYLTPVTAAVLHRRPAVGRRDVHLRHPAGDPDHGAWHPGRPPEHGRGRLGVRVDGPPGPDEGPAAPGVAGYRARHQPDDHARPLDGRDRRAHRRARSGPARHQRPVEGQHRGLVPGRASPSSSWPSSWTA